jgi:hypothetical protein
MPYRAKMGQTPAWARGILLQHSGPCTALCSPVKHYIPCSAKSLNQAHASPGDRRWQSLKTSKSYLGSDLKVCTYAENLVKRPGAGPNVRSEYRGMLLHQPLSTPQVRFLALTPQLTPKWANGQCVDPTSCSSCLRVSQR